MRQIFSTESFHDDFMRRASAPGRLLCRQVLIGIAALWLLAGAAQADVLDEIRTKGVLVVGTKGDYQPFGFRSGGALVGFEPDLAADVAERLGVRLELVPVTPTERIGRLRAREVDLVIATMSVTAERRQAIDFVEPSYYAAGVNVLVPKSLRLRVWQQLRGKPVCMIEGSFYVAEIEQRYAPKVRSFKTTGDMYRALKQEDCIAAVYDDTAIIGQLQSPDWQDYEMPLLSILVEPWGIGVKLGETRFADLLSDVVRDWHRSGRIQALEKRWNIPASAFAEEMHRKYFGE